jgi:hypothetical protein
MLIHKAFVVGLPEDLFQDLELLYYQTNLFDFDGPNSIRTDALGNTITDYLVRYLASFYCELFGLDYFCSFANVGMHDAYRIISPYMVNVTPLLMQYNYPVFNHPYISVSFIDCRSILVKEEPVYVPFPQPHESIIPWETRDDNWRLRNLNL